MWIQKTSTTVNMKNLQHEYVIGPIILSVFHFECLLFSGLPGEAGDGSTVCAGFYHLGLPCGFSVGGAKDLITFLSCFL